ncbi:hypothetical protein [Acinetobacter baumannii]|uniref:hypothetical protein n=1 Tax=Acinetobacter baumannii TaxID=470 RepID=UPI000A3B6094|nr:hypothetical protein [Acinetobacter baumannii]MDC4327114.1 hypothetical protein [Acinetobacter baumannii]MDC4391122.1 hypothetical protein [Acinetobacter baumannii]MDV7555079.1 hypothetical protein [Acinetobacter baumannii]OTT98636.1 hypothetical protein CAT68_09190 [Acinetobacter baumannii]RYL19941.1 hypothetical protein EWO92_02815 [Acinetobacter baumannii]
MFKKLTQLFQGSKETPEQIYLQENQLSFDSERGPVIKDVVINEKWSEHLEYFSNRKLQNFDNLPKLFQITPQINEKIDLEIATQRYVERLGNTQEKLLELKAIIRVLNQYYVMFLRDK